MELSTEQQEAFDNFLKGRNVFVTGAGGTGKSALIKKIYSHAVENGRNIQVSALTGCAAILLGCKACTLHSWAGIGLGNGTLDEYVFKIQKSRFKKLNWLKTSILIVDEVSMLSLKLFHLLDDIGRQIRKSTRPFGGIQLIFCGDFFQLPPVGKEEDPESSMFCFESERWNSVFPVQIELKKVFRQNDEDYIAILHQIREGSLKKRSNEFLLSLVGREKPPDLVITRLFPKRMQVDAINRASMEALPNESHLFESKREIDLPLNNNEERRLRSLFTPDDIQMELDMMSSNLMCEHRLQLKLGAQVMCIINVKEEGGRDILCNGSQGKVIEYCSYTKSPVVLFNNGVRKIMHPHVWQSDKIPGVGISQIPLVLAWAVTIHKSQGATLDTAEVDVGSGIFECGQTYVALSRVRDLNGLYLSSFDFTKIKVFRKVKLFYEMLREKPPIIEEKKDSNVKVIKLK